MATPTKIKVGREVLLARLKEIETENQERYLNALDEYATGTIDFQEELANKLADIAAQLFQGKDVEGLSNAWKSGVEVLVPGLRIPVAPSAPDKTLGKLIRTLELSNEDTITVSATDTYYHYL